MLKEKINKLIKEDRIGRGYAYLLTPEEIVDIIINYYQSNTKMYEYNKVVYLYHNNEYALFWNKARGYIEEYDFQSSIVYETDVDDGKSYRISDDPVAHTILDHNIERIREIMQCFGAKETRGGMFETLKFYQGGDKYEICYVDDSIRKLNKKTYKWDDLGSFTEYVFKSI